MLLLALSLLFSPPTMAENRIAAKFDFSAGACRSMGPLLELYGKSAKELRELKAKGAPQETIARYEMAMEVLVIGLDPNQHGATVIAHVNGPKVSPLKIPSISMNGKTFPLASVSGDGVFPHHIEVGAASQVKIDFKLLGLCGFVNQNGEIGDQELQAAVDSILGR